MTSVTCEQLTHDMRLHAQQLVNEIGIVPRAEDRPLEADDRVLPRNHGRL